MGNVFDREELETKPPKTAYPFRERLFSFPWQQTLLELIPTDQHPLIESYCPCHTWGPTLIPKFTSRARFPLQQTTEAARVTSPYAIAVDKKDPSQRIFIADSAFARIRVFSRDGKYLKAFGGFGWEPGLFSHPLSLAFALNGDLILLDGGNDRVQVFDPAGEYKSLFGGPGSGPGQLSGPHGIDVNPADGTIVVSDTKNHRCAVFQSHGDYRLTKIFGKRGTGSGLFDHPVDVVVDGYGNYMVCDAGNHRLQIFDSEFQPLCILGGPTASVFQDPISIQVDREGDIVVCEGSGRIQVVFRNWTAVGLAGHAPGTLWSRMSRGGGIVAIDDLGRILIVDEAHHITVFA